MASTRLSPCANQVRRQDQERYLTALFAPAACREDLFALYAFNLEVAKTAEVVSEAMIGRIRLQWWREAIEEIYENNGGRPRAHAVVEPLAGAVTRHDLPRAPFERLIDAREADLDGEPPADLAALEAYAEGSAASLFTLALGVLDTPTERGPASEAVRHLGIAWALTGLGRAVPFHARQRRSYLPADLTREAGLEEAELFALRASPALARVVEALAETAGQHLAAARGLRREFPRTAMSLFLFASLAADHLSRLRRAGFDPFDLEVQAERPGAVWRLAWAHWLRRI